MASTIGRSSAKLRRSPLTAYERAGNVTFLSAAPAALPHGEANQLQAVERSFGEVEFGIGQLAGRVALVVWRDLDRHGTSPCVESSPAPGNWSMEARADQEECPGRTKPASSQTAERQDVRAAGYALGPGVTAARRRGEVTAVAIRRP